jgi:hypothetical protein
MALLDPLAEASDKRLIVDLDAEGWAVDSSAQLSQ